MVLKYCLMSSAQAVMLCLTEEHMHLGGSIQAWITEVLVVEVNANETIIHIQHIGF